MNKKLVTLGLAAMLALSTVVSAAPIDDLKASVQKYRNPTGTYLLKMNIPFTKIDPMNIDSVIDIQAEPYCARVKNSVVMGKQQPTTSMIYEEKVGNQLKTYTKEKLHKTDKTESWVYELDPIAPGETIMNAVNPNTLFTSVQEASLIGQSGNTKRIALQFDCAKLFSNFGMEHTLKEGTNSSKDPKLEADFEKEFNKLRKSGTLAREAVITNGVLTQISADITKPVNAFENVIKRGVSRHSHTGVLGDWLLGMLLKTGKSTMTLNLEPLQEAISVPAEVRNAAVPKPATTTAKK